MARQRMLHPDFFTDPKVVRCSFPARLLFQGLWCLADREGRLEADPFALKLKLMPADNVDVSALLAELADARLIQRYEVEGDPLIWLPGFAGRQRPHPKEVASVLPPPPEVPVTRAAVKLHGKVAPKTEERSSLTVLPAESFPSGSSFPSFPSVAESGDAPPPPPQKENIAFVVLPPSAPPEEWQALDFWRWAQSKRQDAKLLPEKHANPRELSTWWSAARGQCPVHALQEAFYRYGEDKFWQQKMPPLPWKGFASEWAKYVPIGGVNASS